MKIEGNPKAELDSLRRQKLQLINNEQTEIEGLKNYYKNQKDIARDGHVEQLGTLQNAQRQELLTTIDEYQDRLKMKLDSYKNQETDLEQSRLALIQKHQDDVKSIRAEFLDKGDFQFQNTLQRTEDMRHKTENLVRKAQVEAAKSASEGQRYFATQLDQQAHANDAHRRRSENQLKQAAIEQEKEKEMALHNLQQEASRELQFQTNRSQNILDGQRMTFEKQMKLDQEKYTALIAQQRESFQQRYNALKDANDRMIHNASAKISQGLDDIHSQFINQKELVEIKQQDPFYQPTVLRPRVEESERHYLVHLEIPEHEKELVAITAKHRTIKMSFTRKMGQEFKTEDGTINKSKRSELMTKEIFVPEIVDGKTVQQKYENGVLTFQIGKA